MRLDNEKTFFNTGVDYIYNGNIDINIDVDKFSLAFFGSQLYSNKFPLIEKTEDDYEKAYSRQCRDNHNPPQSSKSDHISFLKYEDKKYGTKKQYINILGLNLLSDIINSMPCNEEIISMISETIVVNSRYTNKIDQANPSNMISYEKEIINKMINLLEYTPEIYLREVNEGEQKTIKVLRNHYVN